MRFLLSIILLFLSISLLGNDIIIYVSNDGNDNNSGTIKSPFKTLEKAIENINKNNQNDKITIILKEGNYEIKNTIIINELNHVKITAKNDEKVILTGGKQLDLSKIKAVKGTKFEDIFNANFIDHIFMIDLKKEGITDYGTLKPVGFARSYQIAPMELFINNKPCQLARFPNDSTILITDLIDAGKFPKNEQTIARGGTIKYNDNLPKNWKNLDNTWIEGYFHHGYAMDAVQINEWNFDNKTISTIHPHIYGFTSGQPWNRFYAYNIPEEIDQEKEYFIDREKGILFFYSKKEINSLEVSLLENPFFSITHSSNISISNITFQSTRGTAIFMTNNNSCIIDNCTFKNIGSLAIWMGEKLIKENEKLTGILANKKDNYTLNKNNHETGKNNTISNCKIYHTGAGGIRLSGGNRLTLEQGNNQIINCEIHDFNRIEKSYRPAIKIEGVGNIISHCKIYNGINQAILLKGNNHIIEYNDIHDVCLNVDDAGALYYGRNPSERGHIVRHNYFHHIGHENNYQTSAIYHDDGACGMEVYGNVFLKAGSIAIFIGGGSDNYYHNNLFLDCMVGIHIDDRLNNWGIKFIPIIKTRLEDIKYNQPPYSTQYPHLANYWDENPAFPKRNTFEHNIFCSIGMLFSVGNKLLDWKNTNSLSSGYPSIWNDKINNRDFMPNDIYLPLPAKWNKIQKDSIGIIE